MNLKRLLTLTMTLTCLLGVTNPAYTAGGGSMGGGSNISTPAQPKTPQQLAVMSYNKGIRHRDKAWKHQEKMAQTNDAKKIAKLEKKANKEFTKAAKRFKAAIKHEPKLFEAHSSLGYALRNLGDYDNSLVAYNEALRLNPNYTEAIEYRAETYLSLGQFEKTQAAYMKLMKMDRPKADELMAAIQKYVSNPTGNVDADKLQAFKDWAASRNSLATLTSNNTQNSNW